MADAPALLYLETDDEITAVVRRVRAATEERVVLVAPGRSRATSSAVALRLLARMGEEEGRSVAVVGDALTRSLAAEAGLDAYATVEDARRAVPVETPSVAPRAAAIHVVRGGIDDDTAPTSLAAPPRSAGPNEETRPVSIVQPPRPPVGRSRPRQSRRRMVPLVGILAIIAAFIVVAAGVGALVLPAATVAITPLSEPVGPIPYPLTMTDAERASGEVSAEAPVTATGTYEVLEAATGAVLLHNFNVFPVEVPAGTLVATGTAPGDQAFETLETVIVPVGMLTPDGRIQSGDQSVGIVAAAPGPAANVAAGAIVTILDQGKAAQLRGFSNNDAPLVDNPAATAGGVDTSGPAIVQQDVDAAVAVLRGDLAAQVAAALEGSAQGVFVDVGSAPEAVIDGLDGLVGMQNPEGVVISGTMAYHRLFVSTEEVEDAAAERLIADPGSISPGHRLLAGSIAVEIGAATVEDDELVVETAVSARSAAEVDEDVVVGRVLGLAPDAGEAALADLGTATITLWPGWVTTVPDTGWRVSVSIAGVPEDEPSASSPSRASSP